jgi:hypothetical protein
MRPRLRRRYTGSFHATHGGSGPGHAGVVGPGVHPRPQRVGAVDALRTVVSEDVGVVLTVPSTRFVNSYASKVTKRPSGLMRLHPFPSTLTRSLVARKAIAREGSHSARPIGSGAGAATRPAGWSRTLAARRGGGRRRRCGRRSRPIARGRRGRAGARERTRGSRRQLSSDEADLMARSLQGCQPVLDFPCLPHRLAAWHSPPRSANP